MEKDLRIALSIFNAPVGQTDDNLSRTCRWVEEASDAGAEIICFPETSITGYSNQTDIHESAEPVPGPSTEVLSALAVRHSIVILAGIVEKGSEKRIYASHLVITPDGDIGVYRKLHISPREKAAFTPGSTIPLFDVKGTTFGIQLCYDAHFPDLSTSMAERGADIIFIPHASPRVTPEEKLESWMRHLPARAYDNSVYVLACNQTGPNGKGLMFSGLAVIIGPSGKILEKDVSGKEGLLIADLSAEDLAAVRSNTMHHFLPNRRPELY
jgi:predicted amidohydrolase